MNAADLILAVLDSENGFCDRGVWEDGYGPETWQSDEMIKVVIQIRSAIRQGDNKTMIGCIEKAKQLLAVEGRDHDDRLDNALLLLKSKVTPEG